MLTCASLSSHGISVDAEGGVTVLSHKFRFDYRVARVTNDEEYRLNYVEERWDFFNGLLFGHSMKKPKFEIKRSSTKLGLWYPGRRLIAISTRMFLSPNDLHTLNTLIHEMCHQYVDTVISANERDDHGPVWQSTMMSVGLPTGAMFEGPKTLLMKKTEVEDFSRRTQTLTNGDHLHLNDTRLETPQVLRFISPDRGFDYPIVTVCEYGSIKGGAPAIKGTAEFVKSVKEWKWYGLAFLVIPGPLKIKTPAYRAARIFADSISNK